METRIALKYSGPAVKSGQMSVYEASANMIAFSNFVVLAAKAEFGESIDARAEVAGFGRGSFITDLVFNVAGSAATIFSAATPKELLEIIGQSFELWKHLKGSPPPKVERRGQEVHVTNNNGHIITVSAQTINVVFSEKGAESVGQFVRTALDREGMDSVELHSGDKTIGRVTQAESHSFVPVSPAETIADQTFRMGLMVEAPVFKDGNKWRFSDGQLSFYAEILDKEFILRVDAGELFGKGDVLIADVRITQQQSGMKLAMERAVIKVHEHKHAAVQLALR